MSMRRFIEKMQRFLEKESRFALFTNLNLPRNFKSQLLPHVKKKIKTSWKKLTFLAEIHFENGQRKGCKTNQRQYKGNLED